MGSFLSGIFTGSNRTLDGDVNNAGNIMGFGTTVGEGDIAAASEFDRDLLSGNEAKQAELLAPQISGIQKRGQEQMQTASQFGNRSGGTNAGNQNNIDTQRSEVNDMISKLTGKAASDLGNLGTSTLGIGLNANEVQAREAQQRLENEKNSVFGKGIGDFAETGLNAAEGAMGF